MEKDFSALPVRKKRIGYQAPQFEGCRSILELGPAFRALVEEFTVKAAEAHPDWPEKDAVIYFMYEGRPYYVGEIELDTTSSRFACIEEKLIDRLYALGAYEMFYAGMLD